MAVKRQNPTQKSKAKTLAMNKLYKNKIQYVRGREQKQRNDVFHV